MKKDDKSHGPITLPAPTLLIEKQQCEPYYVTMPLLCNDSQIDKIQKGGLNHGRARNLICTLPTDLPTSVFKNYEMFSLLVFYV